MRGLRDVRLEDAHNDQLMSNAFVAAMLGSIGFVAACLWVIAT